MGIFIDTLTDMVRDSTRNNDTSRRQWQEAIDQVYGCQNTDRPDPAAGRCVVFHPDTGTVLPASESMLVDLDRLGTALGENNADVLLSEEDDRAQEAASEIGVALIEDEPEDLDAFQTVIGSWNIFWEIDSTEGLSPARAAADVWLDTFGRGPHQPTSDEACVFTVTDGSGRRVQIDLSDEKYADLFTQPGETR